MTDIRTILQDFAQAQSWLFLPARRDFQNLHDVTDFIYSQTENLDTGETVLFLDPIIRKAANDRVTVTGSFLILTNSNLDAASYDEKYINYIAPLINLVQVNLYNKIRCEYDINDFTVIEVINQFDFNGDGVHTSFNLTGYDRTFSIPEIEPVPAPTESSVLEMGRGITLVSFLTPAADSSVLDGADWVTEISDTEDFSNILETITGTFAPSDFYDGVFHADAQSTFAMPFYYRNRNIKDGKPSEWLEQSAGFIG